MVVLLLHTTAVVVGHTWDVLRWREISFVHAQKTDQHFDVHTAVAVALCTCTDNKN